MLVREPEKRASLAEIAADPWLAPALQDDALVPLVSRETVSEEDHSFIITKMVNGKIASKEDILECVEKDFFFYLPYSRHTKHTIMLSTHQQNFHQKHCFATFKKLLLFFSNLFKNVKKKNYPKNFSFSSLAFQKNIQGSSDFINTMHLETTPVRSSQ